MEKEILRQILNQLDHFRNDQIVLLIIVFFVFIIISILQGVYTSRLIDKYRNELKKNEIKFSVFNELQINKLSSLFELTSELKGEIAKIHNELKANDIKLDIEKWKANYREFDAYYTSNRYIVPRPMKLLISDTTKKLSSFNFNIGLLKERLELTSHLLTDISDEERNKCLGIIESEIKDYNFYNETLEIMIFCEQLKEMIEEYFEKLE